MLAVTHAHPDHMGGLPALLAAFPDAKVVAHEDERKYLVGDAAYAPADSLVTKLAQWLGIASQHPVKVRGREQLPADHWARLHGGARWCWVLLGAALGGAPKSGMLLPRLHNSNQDSACDAELLPLPAPLLASR